MKKFGLLSCFLGLFFGFSTTIHAELSPICKLSPPKSCFFVTENYGERKKRTGDTFPDNVNTPVHCPDINLRGLKDDTMLMPLYTKEFLDVDTSKGSIQTMRNLQLSLYNEDSCGEKRCAPIGKEISEYPIMEPDGTKVLCTETHFTDGKYGVCTKEAIRRYIDYFKVTTATNNKDNIKGCDTQPQLEIIPPETIQQNNEGTYSITATGGKAWIWDNESMFIAKSIEGEALTIDNIKLTHDGKQILAKEIPPITLNEPFTLSFTTAGDEILKVTGGNVAQKSTLIPLEGTKKINIISIEDKDTPSSQADLSCKQLLPKYLVGASCDPNLHGDARDVTYWIQKFSGKITTFIAALAVLLIAWNAFGLVMAGGDTDAISTRKKALMWVGIGLLLTVFAYVIIKTAISLSFLQ